MAVKLLTEHHSQFLSLKGGCIGSFESTLVKMPDCWKSHVMVYLKRMHYQELIRHTCIDNVLTLSVLGARVLIGVIWNGSTKKH